MHPYARAVAALVLVLVETSQTAVAAEGNKDNLRRGQTITALDRYVAQPDPSYAYRLVNTIKGDGSVTFVLDLTSQTWLTEKEVDRPVWKHWLVITEPAHVTSDKALLLISGGSNERAAPKSADRTLARIASASGSVVAELRMVPNQPLTFVGETEPRGEDALIAYTWDKYLRTGDEKWPARLPMTKSAVRAMDAVQSFCASAEGGKVKVDAFVVAGASKRGWTTWTTAAVDKRVVGIAPIVIDTLNVERAGAHQFAAYGFFAPSLQDYVAMKIPSWAGTPQYRALLKIEDPYEYRDRLTMPKLVMNAAGDQYFPPDNSQFYFGDLPGPKYLRYVPNTDHSLKNSDAPLTLLAFHQSIVHGSALPKFSWTLDNDGSTRVKADDRPAKALLWQATNPDARDFRLETLGPLWKSSELTPQAEGVYAAAVQKPAKGWTAFFVELTFPHSDAADAGSIPIKLTTQVRVVPDVLPFKFEPKTTK